MWVFISLKNFVFILQILHFFIIIILYGLVEFNNIRYAIPKKLSLLINIYKDNTKFNFFRF